MFSRIRWRKGLIRHLSSFRFLAIRPLETLDPETNGVRILNPSQDTFDLVYAQLRKGHYIQVEESLETAAKYHQYVTYLCQMEFPVVDVPSLIHQQSVAEATAQRLVLSREFWMLPDFQNRPLNTSFYRHILYFEETHWNDSIYKQFIEFAEKAYPLTLHSHLSITDYLALVDSFAAWRNGVCFPHLLGKIRLHPLFGVKIPKPVHLQPVALFLKWFSRMQAPLMLQRLLCLNVGSGALPFSLSRYKTELVFNTDPNPRAIYSMILDARKFKEGKFHSRLQFQTAPLFPELFHPHSTYRVPHTDEERPVTEWDMRHGRPIPFDCVVYTPSVLQLSHYESHESPYAPGLTGIDGDLEFFFEHAGAYLRNWGVAVVVTSNFRTLLEPEKPHPVEFEIKHHRRWVVLDYFDAPMVYKDLQHEEREDWIPDFIRRIRVSLRAEVWVLHPLEAIEHFAFLHGVPGAEPPELITGAWHRKRLKHYQRKVLQECAESTGSTVRDLKTRLASVLEYPSSEIPEDEETEYLRMRLDPHTYIQELGKRRQKHIALRDLRREEVQQQIAQRYPSYAPQSPRDAFRGRHAQFYNIESGSKKTEIAEKDTDLTSLIDDSALSHAMPSTEDTDPDERSPPYIATSS